MTPATPEVLLSWQEERYSKHDVLKALPLVFFGSSDYGATEDEAIARADVYTALTLVDVEFRQVLWDGLTYAHYQVRNEDPADSRVRFDYDFSDWARAVGHDAGTLEVSHDAAVRELLNVLNKV